MAAILTNHKQEPEMEDLFISVVKQLARSPYITADIPEMLVRRGLSRHSFPSSSEKSPSKSSSTYWYTTAGMYGWKLQRQITRDAKDASKRQATGVCRILNDKDEPVGYGEELVMRMAILVLLTPDPKIQAPSIHSSSGNNHPAAAAAATAVTTPRVALPAIRTTKPPPAAAAAVVSAGPVAPAVQSAAPMNGGIYSAAEAAADMLSSQQAAQLPAQPVAAAAAAWPSWTAAGHPLASKTMPVSTQSTAASYGQVLHSATRGRMRSTEVKKCKVESWLGTQTVAAAGVEMRSST